MQRSLARREPSSDWLYWPVWLVLLASACVPVAWGQSPRGYYDYRDNRGDDRYRREWDRRHRDADFDFMRRLMDFEQAAYEVARAGRTKTAHGELRSYLEDIERSSRRRIDRVNDWMDSWYRTSYDPRSDPKYDQRAAVLRDPDVRADEFEIRLLKTMIEQRQEENRTISRNLPRLERSDLREFAQAIYDRHADQIRQLQLWLKRWYDISYRGEYDRR